MQYCESFENQSLSDGIGMGFDRWTTNSILQYSYTHHNTGVGLMIGSIPMSTTWELHSVLRYNVSEQDARNGEWAALLLENWNASEVEIYGNTVQLSSIAGLPDKRPAAVGFYGDLLHPCEIPGCASPRVAFSNNIFSTTLLVPPEPPEPTEQLALPVIRLRTGAGTSNSHAVCQA